MRLRMRREPASPVNDSTSSVSDGEQSVLNGTFSFSFLLFKPAESNFFRSFCLRCRDKEALNQYKLSLKRKLCSRAGTRPSAASTGGLIGLEAARILLPTIEPHHDVTRAPSGESPSSPESGGDDEPDTGKCAASPHYNDSPSPVLSSGDHGFNFTFSPSPHSTINQLPSSADSDSPPLFFTQHMHINQHHNKHRAQPRPQSLARIASPLLSLLKRSSLPAEYANIASQLIDLHFFKSHALASQSPHANVEHEAARRAQLIDAELSRLANRSAFDNLFAGTTGFAFDPLSFLAPNQSSHSNTSPYAASYSSPMTMWSPELVSDSMSTFSGSSAPTSPAAPMLAMTHTPMGDMFYDPMAQHQQMYEPYMPMNSLASQSQQFGSSSALGFGDLGALGLSSDFSFSDYSTPSSHPAISLLPPTPTPSSTATAMPPKIAPSVSSIFPSSPAAAPAHDSDPFQIHHETCTLLLQAVLTSTSGASHFDFVNPGPSHELEECLQRLTTKFAPLSLSLSPEYLFGATVAGALSVSADRRAFFGHIVAAIEGRTGSSECAALLDEVWRE